MECYNREREDFDLYILGSKEDFSDLHNDIESLNAKIASSETKE